MSRQHSIVKHVTNYFYVPLEDDFLTMYDALAALLDPIKVQQSKKISGPSDCKAMIASIIEGWMNYKRPNAKDENDLYVYFTYDEWIQQLRGRYKRTVIIQCLKEMEEEGTYTNPETGETLIGTIKKRHHIQNTFAYLLNLPVIHTLLDALPEQSPFDMQPRPVLGRPKLNRSETNGISDEKYRSKINGINMNGISQESRTKMDDITTKYRTKMDASFYTQNPITQNSNKDIENGSMAHAIASPAPSTSLSQSFTNSDELTVAIRILMQHHYHIGPYGPIPGGDLLFELARPDGSIYFDTPEHMIKLARELSAPATSTPTIVDANLSTSHNQPSTIVVDNSQGDSNGPHRIDTHQSTAYSGSPHDDQSILLPASSKRVSISQVEEIIPPVPVSGVSPITIPTDTPPSAEIALQSQSDVAQNSPSQNTSQPPYAVSVSPHREIEALQATLLDTSTTSQPHDELTDIDISQQAGGISYSQQEATPQPVEDEKKPAKPRKPKRTDEVAQWYIAISSWFPKYLPAEYESTFCLPQSKSRTSAIVSLLEAKVSLEDAEFVFGDICKDKDPFWHKHRDITAVNSQFSSRISKKPKTIRMVPSNGSASQQQESFRVLKQVEVMVLPLEQRREYNQQYRAYLQQQQQANVVTGNARSVS
jgi:hypothetical protein